MALRKNPENDNRKDLLIALNWLNDVEVHLPNNIGIYFSHDERFEDLNLISLDDLCLVEPDYAWNVIKRIPKWIDDQSIKSKYLSRNELQSLVGAGPIQDIIEYHGERILINIISDLEAYPDIAISLQSVDDFGFSSNVSKALERIRS